jgi:hypothetical protein
MKTQEVLESLVKGDEVTIHLKNGEVMTGLFQFIDGDEFDGDIVLKALGSEKTPMLGWKICWINKIFVEPKNK